MSIIAFIIKITILKKTIRLLLFRILPCNLLKLITQTDTFMSPETTLHQFCHYITFKSEKNDYLSERFPTVWSLSSSCSNSDLLFYCIAATVRCCMVHYAPVLFWLLQQYPAENLLKNDGFKKWKCAAGEKQAVIVFQVGQIITTLAACC